MCVGVGVGVEDVVTSLAPYLIVSGRSQSMSRSCDSVCRLPRTVVGCESSLTTSGQVFTIRGRFADSLVSL